MVPTDRARYFGAHHATVTPSDWSSMVTKDPRVDDYIARAADFAKPILTHIREVIHAACPDVEETVKWRMPTFMHHGILCNIAAFKAHVALNIWKGSEIVGTDGEREAMGQFGRITKLSDLPSKKVLASFIKKAMARNESGVKSSTAGKPVAARKVIPTTPPPDFKAALAGNAKARATFDGFSPSNRKEYIEWITDAKRDETRQRRLREAIAMLAEGKTRNWKYS
jgi:uncharacterized protein YdeI (YjbR/CyaY-like superfamily)